ncbi:AAA family ATPase [Paracidovorax sp. MALMAid1276]|uniref:AAA family ATPase n=1 Tax=Paracidovorax sp. MALMAid1276 TaxID=3411631 RepID=UPI003B9D294B
MLIVFSGLPGTGKTTLAQALAAARGAAYLRIDAIEQALCTVGGGRAPAGPEGYRVAYALAESNLRLGLAVVADCVNPLEVTRAAWRDVARRAGAPLVEVEVVCPDRAEHRRRVEGRRADLPGHVLPTWASVLSHEYAPWQGERLVLDTAALSVPQALDALVQACTAAGASRQKK